MNAIAKPMLDLTADDLMARDVVCLREDLPLREAGEIMLTNQVGGAPVVDAEGKCVGVLSTTDFVRLAGVRPEHGRPGSEAVPVTCPFQGRHKRRDGQDVTTCLLPPGVCPVQVKERDEHGHELLVCSQPRCFLTSWQVIEMEELPGNEVRHFMTADPVMVHGDTPIRVLAKLMIDAHIHRVIIVDDEDRPTGLVSSTDLLAVLANAEDKK